MILTADHGEGRGDHGETSHAFLVYESTIRVPLVLWGAEVVPKGRRVPSLVRTVDLLPTALELARDPRSPTICMAFRWPAASAIPTTRRSCCAYGESIEIAARLRRRAAAVPARGRVEVHPPGAPALYDLSKDPGELDNLASAHPERTQAMRQRARSARRSRAKAASDVGEVGADRAAQLEALGYVSPTHGDDLTPRLGPSTSSGLDPDGLLDDIHALETGHGPRAKPVAMR